MFLSRTFTAWLWAAVILIFCLLPGSEFPKNEQPFADKLFHVLSFAVLTFLLIPALIRQYTFKILRFNAVAASLIFSVLFGGIIELLQHWGVKNRNADLMDWLFDGLGSFAGVALFFLIYGFNHFKNKRTWNKQLKI